MKTIFIVIISFIMFNIFTQFLSSPVENRYTPKLPYVFGDFPRDSDIIYDTPIVRLEMPNSYCTAWIIDKHYAITAAHCISNDKDQIMKIFSNTGILIKDNIKVAGFDKDLDLGLLIGDFHQIRPLKLNLEEEGFPFVNTPTYFSCGYPLGQKHLTCTDFKPIKTSLFQILGYSHIISGMSGGPVIDNTTGGAVAVNSAVDDEGYAYVSPIEGILGLFGLE